MKIRGGWFGLRHLVFELITSKEGGTASGLGRVGIVVPVGVVPLGVDRPEALPRALDVDVEVVDETGDGHISDYKYRLRLEPWTQAFRWKSE